MWACSDQQEEQKTSCVPITTEQHLKVFTVLYAGSYCPAVSSSCVRVFEAYLKIPWNSEALWGAVCFNKVIDLM